MWNKISKHKSLLIFTRDLNILILILCITHILDDEISSYLNKFGDVRNVINHTLKFN